MHGEWETVRNAEIDELNLYAITTTALENMGLNDIANGDDEIEYLVMYDKSDFTKMDVVYLPGFKFKGTSQICYTLVQLQNIENGQ